MVQWWKSSIDGEAAVELLIESRQAEVEAKTRQRS